MNRPFVVLGLLAYTFLPSWGCSSGPERNQPASASSPTPSPGLREVEFAPPDPATRITSIVPLLVDPKRMDGRSVSIGGYLHLGFEANYFCLHKHDVDYRLIANCVWIEIPQWKSLLAFSNHYVVVQGVVEVVSGEEASISKVRRIVIMEDPAPVGKEPKGEER